MGDRANIYVKDPYAKQGVYLYSHWGGDGLAAVLAKALDRGRNRWDDGPYLTRIIFCEMVRGDIDGETGYGIATYMPDNEHPVLLVDTGNKTVSLAESGDGEPFQTVSMAEFVADPAALAVPS